MSRFAYQLQEGKYVFTCTHEDGPEILGKPLSRVGLVMLVDKQNTDENRVVRHGDPDALREELAVLSEQCRRDGSLHQNQDLVMVYWKMSPERLNGFLLDPKANSQLLEYHLDSQAMQSEFDAQPAPQNAGMGM